MQDLKVLLSILCIAFVGGCAGGAMLFVMCLIFVIPVQQAPQLQIVEPVLNAPEAMPMAPPPKPIRIMGEWNAIQITFAQKMVLKNIVVRHPSYAGAKMSLRDVDDLDNAHKKISTSVTASPAGEATLQPQEGEAIREAGSSIVVRYEPLPADHFQEMPASEVEIRCTDEEGADHTFTAKGPGVLALSDYILMVDVRLLSKTPDPERLIAWNALHVMGKNVANIPFSISGKNKILAGRKMVWLAEFEGKLMEIGNAKAKKDGSFLIYLQRNREFPPHTKMQVRYAAPASEGFQGAEFGALHLFVHPKDYDAKVGDGAHIDPQDKNTIIIE